MKRTPFVSFCVVCVLALSPKPSVSADADRDFPENHFRELYRSISSNVSTAEKRKLVAELSLGLDSDSNSTRQQVRRWLYSLDVNLVGENVRESVKSYLEHDIHADKIDTILGAQVGLIDYKELFETATSELRNSEINLWYNSEKWGATLALASMGSDRFAQEAIRRASSEKDILLRVKLVLEDLARTQHPVVTSFIIEEYLNSDQRLPFPNERREGSMVAARAAASLARFVDAFPVKKEYYADYTMEDIELCRAWAAHAR